MFFFCFYIFLLVLFAVGLAGTIKKLGDHVISYCRLECLSLCDVCVWQSVFLLVCFLFSFIFGTDIKPEAPL